MLCCIMLGSIFGKSKFICNGDFLFQCKGLRSHTVGYYSTKFMKDIMATWSLKHTSRVSNYIFVCPALFSSNIAINHNFENSDIVVCTTNNQELHNLSCTHLVKLFLVKLVAFLLSE